MSKAPEALAHLTNIMARFHKLRHVRMPRGLACDYNALDYDAVSRSYVPSWQSAYFLTTLQRLLRGGQLASFSIARGAIRAGHMSMQYASLATNLRDVAVNLLLGRNAAHVCGAWIYACLNLEVLEIALSSGAESEVGNHGPLQQFWVRTGEREQQVGYPLRKLSSLYLLSDTGVLIDNALFLTDFPGLKKLALGNFMFWNGSWDA